jgi:hypothetical protein
MGCDERSHEAATGTTASRFALRFASGIQMRVIFPQRAGWDSHEFGAGSSSFRIRHLIKAFSRGNQVSNCTTQQLLLIMVSASAYADQKPIQANWPGTRNPNIQALFTAPFEGHTREKDT